MALFNSNDLDIDTDEAQSTEHQLVKKRQTISLTLGLMAGLVIMAAVHLSFEHYLKQLKNQLDSHETLLQSMRAETNQVIELNKHNEKLTQHCQLLQRLTTKADESREMLNQLHNIAAGSVTLTAIKQRKNIMTLKGETDTIIKLQAFLLRLKQSHSFSSLGLTAINQLPKTKNFYFVLSEEGLSAH